MNSSCEVPTERQPVLSFWVTIISAAVFTHLKGGEEEEVKEEYRS